MATPLVKMWRCRPTAVWIMLGERKYYKESESPVMNLYDCGAEKNSSHFTSLRVLAFLLSRRGESSREGQGYCEVARVAALFEDMFGNGGDVVRTLNRLLYRQLSEANTRATDSIAGASHVRVTSAGWYYSKFLAGRFAYLDLVLQDTPIDERDVERELRNSVFKVDNLADREGEKGDRMTARFGRVDRFLTKVPASSLAGRGEKIHEMMVCRCGGRVPIREVCRARSTTATIRADLGVSGTLGTCGASNASNETRRS